jgi:ferric-dicitrate binding protein FerR (iron transport regulator)
MQQNENDNIRWEKLEEHLDQPELDPEQEGYSKEERSVLHFFKRLRTRLHPVDAQKSFPIEEGWEALAERIGMEAPRAGRRKGLLMKMMRYRLVAAAVLLLAVAGIFWMLNQPSGQEKKLAGKNEQVEKANLPASQQVQLTLADGSKIELGQKQSITEKNGVAILASGDKLHYKSDSSSGKLLFNTLMVPKGKKSQISLPDGTTVWVNSASTITYPVAFTGLTREITLEGEAYFDVKSDAAKPFIVHTGNTHVQVLGTAFNLNGYTKLVRTTLEKGKVQVKLNNQTIAVILAPGEQSVVDEPSGQLKKMPVYTRLYTGWKDGEIYLEDLTLQQIAEQLSRSFDYDFEFADASLKELRFTVDMASADSLQAVLDHISSTTEGLKFSVSGRVVRISR